MLKKTILFTLFILPAAQFPETRIAGRQLARRLGQSPRSTRSLYPSNEQGLNGEHYREAVDLLGGPDKMSTRVWWDVQ